MILMCLFFIIVATVVFSAYETHVHNKELRDLRAKIEELDGNLPCSSICLICRLTKTPCPGKKYCKIYNGKQ